MKKIQKSLTFLLLILVLLLLFLGYFHPITAINEDLGRHLLLGKIIFQTHAIPRTNLLSYTYPDYPFVNSHWLSEVVFYGIAHYFVLNGLLLLTTSIAILTFLFIFLFTAKRFSFPACVLTGVLYINILLERTDVRPEIFSFFFLSLFIVLLYSFRERYTKLIFLLIPLEILWTNMHIYFIIGPVIIFVFFLDRIFSERFHLSGSAKTLGLVLLLSMLATLINPNGFKGALFPFTYSQNYGFPVLENFNIFLIETVFRQPYIIFFKIAFATLLLALLINIRKTTLLDWLLSLGFGIAAMTVVRNFPLFVLATYIPFVANSTAAVSSLRQFTKKYTGIKYTAILKIYTLLLLSFLLLYEITQIILSQGIGFGTIDRAKKAADFFINNHLSGPVYNNFDLGSYLSYRLYPQEKVFIDNRPEAYPKEFFQNVYIPSQIKPGVFASLDRQYRFDTIIVSHWDQTPWKNAFWTTILINPNYTLVYLDDYAVILVKNTPGNTRVIQKYAINEKSFRLPKNATTDSLIRFIYFFEKAGWSRQEANAYNRLLLIDPGACSLRHSLSLLSRNNKLLLLNLPKYICQ